MTNKNNLQQEIVENIQDISIRNAMEDKFFEYAKYVIEDRALPDVRDGLKPVQRRILYSAHELGLRPDKPYKKSARLVGDVLGRFHPHGDTSVYGAQVILTQDFSTRYPLIDGHGNFGSRDGDPAAAMRYTEARLSRFSDAMMADIHKNVVDYEPNFDETEMEPSVLPTMIPTLLANGCSGIAVGMATEIPPHNLGELYDACLYLIEHATDEQEVTVEKLMQFVKGPDFPTYGTIVDTKDLLKAYKTGKGRITLRGKYEIETVGKDTVIAITEIPYQVNKAKLIEKIDTLSKEDKIEGIKEVNDESSKKGGLRIAVYLKKNADARLILNKLLKHTDLQTSVGFNMMALVDNQPLQLGLKDCLDHFLAHCAEIITRRTQFDLEKINARTFIIEGIQTALEDVDNTIALIKAAKSAQEGITSLMDEYELEEVQAKYIWDMKLNAISSLNTEKLEEEYMDLLEKQRKCISILNDQSVLLSELANDISTLKEKYADERRTDIDVIANTNISEEDLIEDENLVVTVTTEGLIKSVSEKEYNTQKRGGKGVKTQNTKDDEVVMNLFTMNSKDDLLFLTNTGRCHAIKAYKIPKTAKNNKGKSINNYISLQEDEYPVSIIATKMQEGASIVFITRNGTIKRLPITHLSSRMSVTKVIGIKEGDELVNALMANEGDELLIATGKGQSIRIKVDEKELRPMGRTAAGVKGIKLKEDDYVVDMTKIDDDKLILSLSQTGLGKTTKANEYKVQKRGGSGVKGHKITSKTGDLVCCLTVSPDDEIFVGTLQGQIIRIKVSDVPTSLRDTSGSRMIKLYDEDVAITASIAPIKDEEEELSEE